VDQAEFIPESDEAVLPDDEHLRWCDPEAEEAESTLEEISAAQQAAKSG
jgi:hypothetical protein